MRQETEKGRKGEKNNQKLTGKGVQTLINKKADSIERKRVPKKEKLT